MSYPELPEIRGLAERALSEIRKYPFSDLKRIQIPSQERIFLNQREMFRNVRIICPQVSDEIRITLHATSPANLPSICISSLWAPYDYGHEVVHGNAYGDGVYTTTSLDYAKSLVKDGIILVVAVLIGEQKPHSKKLFLNPDDVPNSWIGGRMNDMVILQGSSQVLPLFVATPGIRYGKRFILDNIEMANAPAPGAIEIAGTMKEKHPAVELGLIAAMFTRESYLRNLPVSSCFGFVDSDLSAYNRTSE